MKRSQDKVSPKKQWLIVSGLVLLLFVLALLVIVADHLWSQKPTWVSPSVQVERKTAKVEGEVICLPRRETNTPHTQECALGVRDRDGYYYGVKNQKDIVQKTGETIEVFGGYTPAADTEVYDIVGTIDVADR
ncbi:TPA: hypothetical protein DDX46_00480 [Candidatus Saccharibacteria bacterium]|nr:MAG: hypothetical protein UW38_C0001G0715 [Candidatus Saccharibacteria bacterium GW2011_GWC2_44_17]MBH1956958.1 hypothetical protein [Candidatus Saccharibacteria bacterium]OGL33669.1 MAG: hypothetical protein A3E20_02865 [Candidatus Saccharibacteria bacterium RIFCSPHIGHO2_12_FULL_47_16]MBH1973254.1 hypothetical protein [Candidatus Saccharibacteria bacterium]MBH1990505.1 hypothetical protein [Candidatus Saccharibacteria bacterium]